MDNCFLYNLFFRPQLQAANLQPVQMSELETEFSKIEGQKAAPTKFIRSQQVKQAKMAAEAVEDEGNRCKCFICRYLTASDVRIIIVYLIFPV